MAICFEKEHNIVLGCKINFSGNISCYQKDKLIPQNKLFGVWLEISECIEFWDFFLILSQRQNCLPSFFVHLLHGQVQNSNGRDWVSFIPDAIPRYHKSPGPPHCVSFYLAPFWHLTRYPPIWRDIRHLFSNQTCSKSSR